MAINYTWPMPGSIILTSEVYKVMTDIPQHFPATWSQQKLLFIETAADIEPGPKPWLEKAYDSLVKVGFEVRRYTLTDQSHDQVATALDWADIIYMSGGNTFYLLQELQRTQALELIRDRVLQQGKTYLGSSAGSIVAGPDTYPALRLDKLEAAPNLGGYQGLGLVNFVVLPHWGSRHFKDLYLNFRLEHAYQPEQSPLLLLTDHHYAIVKADQLTLHTATPS
jgi:dipeptidase E